ncbi:MAG TPA: YdjY domain-containing protein [Planctomycetota bacterium]|nr:YdjY domain-containing protein [Planctomycetota bacterium]
MCYKTFGFMLLLAAPLNAAGVQDSIAKLNQTSRAEREKGISELCRGGSETAAALVAAESDSPHSAQVLRTLHRIIAHHQFCENKLPLIDVDSMSTLKTRRSAGDAIYYDRARRILAVPASFKLRHGELEYLAVDSSPSAPVHETLLAAAVRPSDFCLALLACGYAAVERLPESGPLKLPAASCVRLSIQWQFEAPHAGMISDNPGQRDEVMPADPHFVSTLRIPIEAFVFNSATRRSMRIAPFVFTGSEFIPNPVTGRIALAADFEGPIAALKFNPSAVLNTALNTRHIDPQKKPGYRINRFAVPDCGTKCLLIVEPWGEPLPGEAELNDQAPENLTDRP